MNFLIGNIEPQVNTGETNFGRELEENKSGGTPQNDPPPVVTEPKKTNWVLYGLLGLVALSIILGNKK